MSRLISEHSFFGSGGIFCCVVVGVLGELCGQHYAQHANYDFAPHATMKPGEMIALFDLVNEARELLEESDHLDPDRCRYLCENLVSYWNAIFPAEVALLAELESSSASLAARRKA